MQSLETEHSWVQIVEDLGEMSAPGQAGILYSCMAGSHKINNLHVHNSLRATRNAARKARQQSLVKVVVVDLGEWRERHFGTSVE